MEERSPGVFHTSMDLPLGQSYFQYFVNRDFQQAVNGPLDNSPVPAIMGRQPLLLQSAHFCPLEFEATGRYLSCVGDDVWELRAVSHQHWIQSVQVHTPFGTHAMSLAFQGKRQSFWVLRLPGSTLRAPFLLHLAGHGQEAYLHGTGALQPAADWSLAFQLPPEPAPMPLEPPGPGYQIFPDSFCRSSRYQPPAAHTLLDWDSPPRLYSFYGGNLEGIREKLPYLSQLGFGFLYLNPIFKAKDAHRYNASDYGQADPILGTNAQFKSMVEAAHQYNLKVILDISVNHGGTELAAFIDVLTHQDRSPYKDWFLIHQYPVAVADRHHYESWHGYKEMPLFNLNCPDVRKYLIDNMLYWVSYAGIDGWRLDVCNEIQPDFLQELSHALKSAHPQLLLIGECWSNANAAYVLHQNGVDGITNYSLYWDVLLPFFVRRHFGPARLARELMLNHWATAWTAAMHTWNFLSNHDTMRFHSLVDHPPRYQQALALVYLLPGVPVVYYGEEVGMTGGADPDNRGAMPWEAVAQHPESVDMISRWNRLRRRHPNLFHNGLLTFPYVDDHQQILVLCRSNDRCALWAFFHFGEAPIEIDAGPYMTDGPFRDAFGDSDTTHGNLLLPPEAIRVFIQDISA